MITIINYIISLILPVTPKFVIKIFANKYIAGTNIISAIKVVKKINKSGLRATLDILGEHTKEKIEATAITKQYIEVLNEIYYNNLDCNISIKPSHIGSDIKKSLLLENISMINKKAIDTNNFIRLDMENNKLTDLTIELFNNFLSNSNNIGIVFQAYLKRTENDISNLKNNTNIRLCKGIYNESSQIAIKDPKEINKNYLKLLKLALSKNIFVGIATHDESLINDCCNLIDELNVDNNKFEFQVLYGVPVKNIINKLRIKNYNIRIYIPYGPDWYKYSMRRLKENPNISKYIIGNMLKRNFYE